MRYGKTALTCAIVFTWLMVFASCAAYSAGRGTLGAWLRLGASVGFVLTGFAAGGLNSRYGRAILAGLLFGWWGDFSLMHGGRAWFMAGLVAFLSGHVAYSCAFVFRRSRPRWAVAAFTAMLVVGIFVAWWLWPHMPAGLHAPAVAYGLAISVMVALAIGALPHPGGWLIAIGAIVFYVSDIGVAYLSFVGSSRMVLFASMLLYYLGQTMLAASIAFRDCFEPHRMRQAKSTDGGRTWSEPHVTHVRGYPPHVIRLRNGRLLAVYGKRWPPYGEYACISRDNGVTWDVDNEVKLAGAPNGDLGYPASVQLDDGTIWTVYYQADQPGEKPCLMGTHWRLRDGR